MSGHGRIFGTRISPSYSGGRKARLRALMGYRSSRQPIFMRSRTCCLALALVLGIIIFAAEMRRLPHKEVKSSTDRQREEALRRIMRQHGGELQAALQQDVVWFGRYLNRLHVSFIHGSRNHTEEEDDDPESTGSRSSGTSKVKPGGSTSGAHSVDGKDKAVKKTGHLNSLDMPKHKVKGVVEPCLKLLPPSKIESLELPPKAESPIQHLNFFRMDEDALEIQEEVGYTTDQKARNVQLDTFAGKQTMMERADSFKVRPSMEVHCGFAAQGGGFDVSRNDRRWMNSCQLVVATCAFGGGDDLYQPIGFTNSSLQRVCYAAFWDDVTLAAQEAVGNLPDPRTHKVGNWRVVHVSNLPFVDQRRNGKIPKLLSHRLFPRARFSIWVDSKSQFRRDPLGVLEALLWREPRRQLAISEHGARRCIYAEGEAIVRKHKALPEEVAVQLNQYRAEGLPDNATFDGHKALAEASVIVREHTTLTNLFMCLWFNEMARFTARDQLSFGYVLRRLDVLKVNMFPVCTRKALVNSMGHKRKPKPLAKAAQAA